MSDQPVNQRRAARYLGISGPEVHRYTVEGLIRAVYVPPLTTPQYEQAELDRVHDLLDLDERRVL